MGIEPSTWRWILQPWRRGSHLRPADALQQLALPPLLSAPRASSDRFSPQTSSSPCHDNHRTTQVTMAHKPVDKHQTQPAPAGTHARRKIHSSRTGSWKSPRRPLHRGVGIATCGIHPIIIQTAGFQGKRVLIVAESPDATFFLAELLRDYRICPDEIPHDTPPPQGALESTAVYAEDQLL